jgi:hypothetical protein
MSKLNPYPIIISSTSISTRRAQRYGCARHSLGDAWVVAAEHSSDQTMDKLHKSIPHYLSSSIKKPAPQQNKNLREMFKNKLRIILIE